MSSSRWIRRTCPEQWRGAFVFEKRVPGSVVAGGDPNVLIYVSIGTVPMGWVAAVDLIQQVARRIVFGMAKIPPELEVKSEGLFPHDGAWAWFTLTGSTWCVRCRAGLRRALPPRRGAKGSGISSWTRATTSSSPSTRANVLYELWVDLSWAVRLTACVVS